MAGTRSATKHEIAVIGSGPGGLVTAALLAEAGRDVVVVEEGGRSRCAPFSRAEMTTKYRHGGVTVALGAKVAYVEGRCVGGGSEINSGLYHRAPEAVLKKWQETHDVLGLDELGPFYEANERDLDVAPLGGPATPASRKLADGAGALGWSAQEVPRWIRDGERRSMSTTFLPRFEAAGGTLRAGTRVQSLSREAERWHVHAGDEEIVVDTVVVACGAIQTPALLRRSGIWFRTGDSLSLHATVKVVARFPDEVNPGGAGVGVHQVKEHAPRFSLGCSISERPHLALGLLDHPRALHELDSIWKNCAVYYAMTGGGSGTVRTLPLFRDPLVRYRLEQSDLEDLAEGLRELCRLLLAAGAAEVYPCVAGLEPVREVADLARLPAALTAARSNLMTVHLMGSCPMGEDWQRCAANSYGRVLGQPRLHVADASLFCGPLGVNPQGTVMALARRNALRLVAAGA